MPLLVDPGAPATGCLSDYCANAILDHLFRKQLFTMPTLYVGLRTGGGVEFVASDYARVATTSSDWTTASGLVIQNSSDFEFGSPTSNWGLCGQVALYDAASGGNLIASMTLTTSQNVTVGLSYVTITAGSLVFTADGYFEDDVLSDILDHIFGHTQLDRLEDCYVALADNYGLEPQNSGVNYVRQQLLPTDWAAASGGAIVVNKNVAFPQQAANYDNTIYVCRLFTHQTLDDSGTFPSGGEQLIGTAWFTTSRTVTSADPAPEFLAGHLRVRLV